MRNQPRGLPPALAPHCVYATPSPREAERFGRDLVGEHRLRVGSESLDDFEATFHAVLVRDVTLGYLDYHAPVVIDIARATDEHLVIVPAAGTAQMTSGHDTVSMSPVVAAVPRPGSTVRIDGGSEVSYLVVRIGRVALELHLARLLGRTIDNPIRFETAFDLSAGTASRWNFAVQILHAEIYDPQSLLHRTAGHGQLEEFVMSSLLYAHRSNFSDQLVAVKTDRRAVRQARAFIERNLNRPLTVADIAAAAGVSVRTLQSQFAEDVGQSPTAYVRNARLERVRADLADAPPGGARTVTEVASRWGFNHLGRFSVAYRARFGESPSQTLRT